MTATMLDPDQYCIDNRIDRGAVMRIVEDIQMYRVALARRYEELAGAVGMDEQDVIGLDWPRVTDGDDVIDAAMGMAGRVNRGDA